MKLVCAFIVTFFIGYSTSFYFNNSTTNIHIRDNGNEEHHDRKRPYMRSENNGKVSEKLNDVSGTSSSDRVSEYLDDSNSQDQFILSIQLVFKTENGLEYFKDIFANMAKWVYNNENGTISYSMAVSDKDMLQVLIYERYVNKDAYLDIHKKSMEFLAFKKKMMAMNEEGVKDQLGWEMTGQSYQKPVGFV